MDGSPVVTKEFSCWVWEWGLEGAMASYVVRPLAIWRSWTVTSIVTQTSWRAAHMASNMPNGAAE